MAKITRTVVVKVLTLDPVARRTIPVPGVNVQAKHHQWWIFNSDLSTQTQSTGADGIAELTIEFDEADESKLNPFFTIQIPAAQRTLPNPATGRPALTLPESWESRHYKQRLFPNLPSYSTRTNPAEIFVGLDATLHLAYVDFDESALRNPFALPENTVRLYLADVDVFLFDFLDFLMPDDTLAGVSYNPRQNALVQAGPDKTYPYFDDWITAPYALDRPDLLTAPRAWVDPPGAPVMSLGGGSFDQIEVTCVDANGFVWMVDTPIAADSFPVIRCFYPNGTLAETFATWRESDTEHHFRQPKGIAVDRQRNLFVADDNEILIFQRTLEADSPSLYTFISRFRHWDDFSDPMNPIGSMRSLSAPRGLAIASFGSDESLVIADGNANKEVHVFRIDVTSLGNLRLSNGSTFGQGSLNDPIAVATDGQGHVYVCDRGNHQISRWSLPPSSVTYQRDWLVGSGAASATNGEFNAPVAIAIDRKHRVVYVADPNNNRTQRLNAENGAHLVNLADPASPTALAVDDRGEVYLGDRTHLIRYTPFAPNGEPLADTAPPQQVNRWTAAQDARHLAHPAYVHFDGAGNLWVSDTGNNRVQRYSATTPNGAWTVTNTIATDLNAPVGIATDSSGNVFVVDSGNRRIRRYDANLQFQADLGNPGLLSNPRGIAIATRAAGATVYVADRGANQIVVFKPDGTTATLTTGGGQTLSAPEDVAVDREGNVWVADTGNGRILKFDPADAFVQVLTVSPSTLQITRPVGLSITPDNRLLVTDRDRVLALSLTGTVEAYWDLQRLVPLSLWSLRTAQFNGTVRFGSGLRVEPRAPYRERQAWRVTTAGAITLNGSDSNTTTINLPLGSIVLVTNGQTVNKNEKLVVTHQTEVFYPDLSQQILLKNPARAAIDAQGRLAIADTGNHRIRLARTDNTLRVNLFELGQGLFDGFPDISFRAASQQDWTSDPTLGLKVTVGDSVNRYNNAFKVETPPQDEYSRDTYDHRALFTGSTPIKAEAINALKVMREVQRWLVHVTRTDDAQHRWGNRDSSGEFLGAELLASEEQSEHGWFADVIKLAGSLSGRGHDAWDDDVIAHEMGHWIFDRSVSRAQVQEISGHYDIEEHFSDGVYSQTAALIEGFAECIQLFWGNQFAAVDRIRGFSSAELTRLRRANGDRVDLESQVGLGLESEGYFANTLWQIYHAIALPDVRFADSSAYWYGFNHRLTDAQSQRVVDLLRVPLRQFPTQPGWEGQATFHLFKQILEQAHQRHPTLAPMIQSIFELNNQLMPVMRIRQLAADNAPGAVAEPTVTVASGARRWAVEVKDATGRPLRGYNLLFKLQHPDRLSFLPAAPAPAIAHGRNRTDAIGFDTERATDAEGLVRFEYQIPAEGAGAQVDRIEIHYEPHFIADQSFAPPQKADTRETTLRQLYLQALAAQAPARIGAPLVQTLTLSHS